VRWITREHLKIDRIACPWLIRRFIDPESVFWFVPPAEVTRLAELLGATPYDVPGVELSHEGPLCSFDAFIAKYRLEDPAVKAMAPIVRGADTAATDLTPECAGLLAISLGLSHNFRDDHQLLERGFVVYDALYSWLEHCRDERHTWNPQRATPTRS